MKLSNTHRESLLNTLEETQLKLERSRRLCESAAKQKDIDLEKCADVDQWLAERRIADIKKALIEDDLENF
jgi:hypothetical protein